MGPTLKILIAWLSLLPAWGLGAALPNPPASRQIFDRFGNALRTELSEAETLSSPVSLSQVSPWMLLATLSAEDKRFYEHGGVDARAVLRAMTQNLGAGKVVSGASTLTQQLARSLEPRPRTLWGKLKEALRAMKIEREASKEEIFEAYLNRAPYGNQAVGVEAASRLYFGQAASSLSLAQAALLAAIPKSPAQFDPYGNSGAALTRQRMILERMHADAWISEESYALAKAERFKFKKRLRDFSAPQFGQFALSLAPPGSAPIRSSLDLQLQQDIAALTRSQIRRLRAQHVGNASVLVIDNRSGEVLAWVGSEAYGDAAQGGQLDGVLARRQPGSSVKPFLYALAFSRGLRTSDLIEDAPYTAPGGYRPLNYDKQFHGPVSARRALACSYNVPAVKVCNRVGYQRFYRCLLDFGMLSLDQGADFYGLGLALGNGDLRLMELANAYAALARGGIWQPLKIFTDKSWPAALPGEPRRVMEAGASYLVTSALSDNAARAPAFGRNSVLQLPFPLAAKTGTTKDYRDNWCVGYTPQWTVAVWSGNFDGTPMHHVSGVTGAAPLMHDVAMRVEEGYASGAFSEPSGMLHQVVCAESGSEASSRCPRREDELFLSWNPPAPECPLHGAALPASAASARLEIRFPRPGEVISIDPSAPRASQKLRFASSWDGQGRPLRWILDGHELNLQSGEAWWAIEAGSHVVELDAEGQAKKAHFRVLP